MSRIGKSPIILISTVKVSIDGSLVSVIGPKGSLSFSIPSGIAVQMKDQTITVEAVGNNSKINALHGLVRAHIDNMIHGVSEGWTKTLVLSGVGYRAALSGSNLVLTVGFSHSVTIIPPEGILFTITEGKIVVSGNDKQVVGQVAANIRKIKPPEPYKGKGIMYEGEHIRKKAGKSAKGAGGAAGGSK